MAVLAIAAVGAVAGGAVGASFGAVALGASIGWAVGSFVGQLAFGPDPPTNIGPRLNDLAVQSSAEGVGIPIVFGRARIAGNVIWAQPIKETRHEEEVGGKGMGGGGTQVSYTYSVSFAIGLCEGSIVGIRKIWADSKLIYDAGTAVTAETAIASNDRAKAIRVYTGTETQTADPTIQSFEGAANTPAYRGLAYMVFEDLELADFANHMPNITVELIAAGVNTPVLLTHSVVKNDPPDGTHQANVMATAISDPNNIILFAGQWTNTYANDDMKIYRPFPGGLAFVRKFALNPTGADAMLLELTSDEPLVIRLLNLANRQFLVFDRDGNHVTTVTVPSDVSPNTPHWHKRGEDYYLADGTGYKQVLRLDPEVGIAAASVTLPYNTANLSASDSYLWVATVSGASFFRLYKLDRSDLSIVAYYDTTLITSAAQDVDNRVYARSDSEVYVWCRPERKILRFDGAFTVIASGSGVHNNLLSGSTFYCDGQIALYWSVDTDASDPTDRVWNRLTVINSLSPNTVPLSSIVSALATRTGLVAGDLDTAALSDAVDGYVIPRPMTVRAAIEQLRQAYFFDGVESDGKVKFVKRGGASVATVASDDLGTREYGAESQEPIRITRAQELELPVEVHVGYLDLDNDYLPGSQEARRLTTSSKNQIRIDLPLALSSAKAAQVADVLLRNAWVERHRFAVALTRRYAHLDPADTITVPTAQGAALVRLTRTDYGASGVLACEALAEDTVLYSSAVVGNDAAVNKPQTLSLAGPTSAILLDTALLRDADDDPGFYVAAAGHLGGWRGAALYKSVDAGATWDAALSLLTAATIGYTTNALGSFTGGNVWDKGNIGNVKLATPNATLSSTTELALYAGANAAAIGAHGRWEIIQFQTATLEADGTYTLSNLLRGRRGTEWAQGTHVSGDVFVLLTTATLRRVEAGSAEIGLQRHYRAVSLGTSLERTAIEAFTNAGAGLECYAPVGIGGGRNGASDIIINWERRTRIGGEWRDYVDASLGETSENYEVEIWTTNFATWKRTITGLTAKTTTYTSSQQVTDFGSNQSSVGVKVYQLSGTVGRGYPGQALV